MFTMRSDETPNIETVSLDVPSLGTIRGLSFNNSTCQFLGIPYAEIPGRFQRSVPAGPWKDGIWDGRKLGYVPCTHPAGLRNLGIRKIDRGATSWSNFIANEKPTT